MPRFEIYNTNAGELIGCYNGHDVDDALDAMARDYGFANYEACIAGYGVDRDTAIAELQITQL